MPDSAGPRAAAEPRTAGRPRPGAIARSRRLAPAARAGAVLVLLFLAATAGGAQAPLWLAPLAVGPAWAVSDPAEMLPDPAQEARAERIGSQLRCLVCQNESIEDSNADLARDLRGIVRQRVKAGDTDEQITAWLVARYGDFVRLRPPFTALTALLWLSPVLALGVGAGAVLALRRRAPAPPPPLTEAERARLSRLTGG